MASWWIFSLRFLSLVILLGLVAAAVLAPAVCSEGPFGRVGEALMPPQAAFFLGTDDLGRSVACLTAFGLGASLAVSIGVLVLSLGIGIVLGLVSGYHGGLTDVVLSRVTAMFQVVPRFFLAIMVVALFGSSLMAIIIVLGVTSWPLIARLVRAETLSLRHQSFVLASRAMGCPDRVILVSHILPNAIPPVRASVAVVVGGAVLAEAALGFIGLSDGNSVSLGRLMAEAYPFFTMAPWMSLAPVTALVAFVVAVQIVAEPMNRPMRGWSLIRFH